MSCVYTVPMALRTYGETGDTYGGTGDVYGDTSTPSGGGGARMGGTGAIRKPPRTRSTGR